MNDSDKKYFLQVIKETFDVYGKEITKAKLRIYFEALKQFSVKQVADAMSAHIARSRFAPMPVDIIEIISHEDGRPDENEAWAMALNSQDENETVVWTDEMAEAFAVANQILLTGDKQGAKMAFREVYSRLVAKARQRLQPVQWRVSLGHDKSRVNDAINQAVIDKKVSHETARRYLIESPTEEGKEVAGLIAGKVVDIKSINREKLAKLKTVIETKKSHEEIAAAKRKAKEAERRDMIEAAKKQAEKYVEQNVEQDNESFLDETA